MVSPALPYGRTFPQDGGSLGRLPGLFQSLEDVAPEGVVVPQPNAGALVVREIGGAGEDEPDVAHRPHERVVLE